MCVFADSFIDLDRQLLSFNAMTDLCAVADLTWDKRVKEAPNPALVR